MALFSALTCDKNLLPLRLFRLDQYLEKTAFIRNICLSGDGDQLWVCNVSNFESTTGCLRWIGDILKSYCAIVYGM